MESSNPIYIGSCIFILLIPAVPVFLAVFASWILRRKPRSRKPRKVRPVNHDIESASPTHEQRIKERKEEFHEAAYKLADRIRRNSLMPTTQTTGHTLGGRKITLTLRPATPPLLRAKTSGRGSAKVSPISSCRQQNTGAEKPDGMEDLMKIRLNQAEFAKAIDMDPEDVFVKRMFRSMARSDTSSVSFLEFVSTIVQLCNGTEADRLLAMFNIIHPEGLGSVARDEFASFVKTVAGSAGLGDSEVASLYDEMSQYADFQSQHRTRVNTFGAKDKSALKAKKSMMLHSSHVSKIMTPGRKMTFQALMKVPADRSPTLDIAAERRGATSEKRRSTQSGDKLAKMTSPFSRSGKRRSSEPIFKAAVDSPKASQKATETEIALDALSSSIDTSNRRKHAAIEEIEEETENDDNGVGDEKENSQEVSIVADGSGQKSSSPADELVLQDETSSREASRSRFRTFILLRLQHVAALFFFVAVCIAFFVEHFIFSVHSDNRIVFGILGYTLAIARGAAGVVSIASALILLPICHHVVTFLQSSRLNRFVPFDMAIAFHKLAAATTLHFSAVHVIFHLINFHKLSFRKYNENDVESLVELTSYNTTRFDKAEFWFYENHTGITGIILVFLMSTIAVFALPWMKSKSYVMFRATHLLFIPTFALLLAHGGLLTSRRYWHFVVGPLVLYAVDNFILAKFKQYNSLKIMEVDVLPDLTHIRFEYPLDLDFKPGQFVKIRFPTFGDVHSRFMNRWHPFSIASSPKDLFLDLYIKPQGNFTRKLKRKIEEINKSDSKDFPLVSLIGPYGGGNQHWLEYEVTLIIGAGVGITPYASILKYLVQSVNSGQHSNVKCRKVYFCWICQSHKNNEWFINDVLKFVEKLDDESRLLESHIFITRQKLDLKMMLLQVCEQHFQRVAGGQSLFTGLRAVNHFGRPSFPAILHYVKSKHADVKEVAVCSCGPLIINTDIAKSCESANRQGTAPHFRHKWESF